MSLVPIPQAKVFTYPPGFSMILVTAIVDCRRQIPQTQAVTFAVIISCRSSMKVSNKEKFYLVWLSSSLENVLKRQDIQRDIMDRVLLLKASVLGIAPTSVRH